MTGRWPPVLLAVALLVHGVPAWGWVQDRQPFDHLRHQRMFPACSSCHQLAGDSVTMPTPNLCETCHDGAIAPVIDWQGPVLPASNLDFKHAQVIQVKKAMLGVDFSCTQCHVARGAERMDVQRVVLEPCLTCHASGRAHTVDAPCQKCHLSLVEATALTPAQIGRFPRPADHDSMAFASRHGPAAVDNGVRCAVCHTQDYCSACHVNAASVPTIQALGSDARVATLVADKTFPPPATHGADWPLQHGGPAQERTPQCAVCHAQEYCSSCHVNAADVPAIQSLAPHPRGPAYGAKRDVVYPTPVSHTKTNWLETHGAAAGDNAATCATCHARPSCESCHVAPLPPAVRRLPNPGRPQSSSPERPAAPPQATGVVLARRAPDTHTPGFAESHQALAAAATAQCTVCHTPDQCTSCHTGSDAVTRPGQRVAQYHPMNFQQQHSASAFGQAVECATCHNPEAFCRDCHGSRGLKSRGRIATGFHAGKPTFIFGHGQAARQGLESCATCHGQRDCLLCHSALTGRRINPHGTGFNAERMREKNPVICLACHYRGILRP